MVLGLIVATYIAAVTLTGRHGSPVVVLMQVVTVWFALRTSRARRQTRIVADVVLVVAALAVLGSTITGGDDPWKGLPVVSALLYFIAPISIIRHLVTRPAVDQETVLGALSA
jgi:heme A synthase